MATDAAPQAPSAVQRAMLALLADGVLGLPQLACCPACCAMQVEIMDACPDCRSDYKGFVFFDNQDSRQAERDGVLALSFGAFNMDEGHECEDPSTCGHHAHQHEGQDGEEEQADPKKVAVSLEVGQKVAAALRSQGLEVDWDGTIDERIIVRDIAPSERFPFALEASAAAWVDAIDVMRVERGQPPEARCSHTCGSGVHPCPHGLFVEMVEEGATH